MANYKLIVNCIKAELKAKKITYKVLAEHLQISESAVKHMFSTGNFSIRRLDETAAVLGLEMSDIIMLANDQESKLERLTINQETELISDMRRLVVAYAVINFWTFNDILNHYRFTKPELTKHLIELQKMGFLDLKLNNRIKPKIASNFSWNPSGPIEKLVRNKVLPEFFSSSFSDHDSERVVKNGDLTENSRLLLAKRIQSLGKYFDELCFKDRNETLGKTRRGTSLILGMRMWSFSSFVDLYKTSKN